MKIRPLGIEGAWRVEPRQMADERGLFLESFRADKLEAATGQRRDVRQTNVSVQSRGTLRGIHFSDVPPGQTKYVTALTGSFLDFVVNVRVGSPTFGRWDRVLLDTHHRAAVFLEEGLGHALYALEDDSTVMYLCSEVYTPRREREVHPLDPRIGLALPSDPVPLLSDRDTAAPTLEQAAAQGILPAHAALEPCLGTRARPVSGS